MILVDIQSPVMDQVYEFELDEEARAEEILKEIVLLIGQKEKVSLKEEEGMQLYALRRESLLDKERTLKEHGGKNTANVRRLSQSDGGNSVKAYKSKG